MVEADPFAEFKAKQREGWKHFAPLEVVTTIPAARLVRFAGVALGQHVLDVGTGTGVVAITARRAGAKVAGLDLTPELLAHAKENAAVAELGDIEWREGDVEDLPYADGTFDVVLSQFGHIFAPRPDVAAKEMLRALRPGGTIGLASWPPESLMGRLSEVIGQYVPLPAGVPPPSRWGEPAIVEQRLGRGVRDLHFERGQLNFPALSVHHYRAMNEKVGPLGRIVQSLEKEPSKLAGFRSEYEAMASRFFRDNAVVGEYLLTRALKG